MTEEATGTVLTKWERIHQAGNLDPANWPQERIETICKMAAPDAKTIPQVAAFLQICERYDLDPILGQIFFADTGKGPKVLTGRDTFITVAERRPGYRGIANGVVMEGDECRIWRDENDPHVVHIDHVMSFGQSNEIAGAYCIAYHENRPPVIIMRRWADFKHLWSPNARGNVKQNWANHPKDMVENRCIAAALRRMYSLSGLLMTGEEDAMGTSDDRATSVVDDQVAALREKLTGEPEVTEAEVVETVIEAVDIWHPENVVLEGKHRGKSWSEVCAADPKYIARIINRGEILDEDGIEGLTLYMAERSESPVSDEKDSGDAEATLGTHSVGDSKQAIDDMLVDLLGHQKSANWAEEAGILEHDGNAVGLADLHAEVKEAWEARK